MQARFAQPDDIISGKVDFWGWFTSTSRAAVAERANHRRPTAAVLRVRRKR